MEHTPLRPVPWWILFVISLATLALDQVTKLMVVHNLEFRETWVPIGFLDGIFDFTYTRNTGAAFGMGQGLGNIFLLIAVIVTGIIVYYYRDLPDRTLPVRVAMGLMLGGAIGNAVDRVRLGYVVDFFHVHGWPIFNIADSAITVGVVLWLVVAWWVDRRISEQNQSAEPMMIGSTVHPDSDDATPKPTSQES